MPPDGSLVFLLPLHDLLSRYELMPITDDLGYVIDDTGIMNDPEGFYIDENNKVYIYDWKNDVACRVSKYQAINYEGGTLRFDERLAEPMLVVNS